MRDKREMNERDMGEVREREKGELDLKETSLTETSSVIERKVNKNGLIVLINN